MVHDTFEKGDEENIPSHHLRIPPLEPSDSVWPSPPAKPPPTDDDGAHVHIDSAFSAPLAGECADEIQCDTVEVKVEVELTVDEADALRKKKS
jgi:hypothetical protein